MSQVVAITFPHNHRILIYEMYSPEQRNLSHIDITVIPRGKEISIFKIELN
jgi:hypothetical protein